MAYKFQLGAASLSGSATFKGDIQASGSNVNATNVSGSGRLIAQGPQSAVAITNDLKLANATSIKITDQNGNRLIEAGIIDNNSAILLAQSGSANAFNCVEIMEGSAGAVGLTLAAVDGAEGVFNWSLNSSSGEISGSGDLSASSVTIAGNTILAGGLTVNGTSASFDTNTLEVSSSIRVSGNATNDAQSYQAGFRFGHILNGGLVAYNSASAEERHIVFNAGAGGAALKAYAFSGNGAALTNVTSDSSIYSVNEVTAKSGTPYNSLLTNKTNIVSRTSTSVVETVLLSTTGNYTSGDVIRVKLEATSDETNYVKISTSTEAGGNPQAKIDGEIDLYLMSPSASVELVYLGLVNSTGSFAIM